MDHDGTNAGWRTEIAALARANESRSLGLQSGLHRALARLGARIPPVLGDYLKALASSILGLWIVTGLLAFVSPVEQVTSLLALGLLFSGQATFYKFKLMSNPTFKIPDCGCGASHADRTSTVLRSEASATAGVPNSLLAGIVYGVQLGAILLGQRNIAVALAVPMVVASAYLGYVMVVRLRSLCSICVSLAALNALILVQLVR